MKWIKIPLHLSTSCADSWLLFKILQVLYRSHGLLYTTRLIVTLNIPRWSLKTLSYHLWKSEANSSDLFLDYTFSQQNRLGKFCKWKGHQKQDTFTKDTNMEKNVKKSAISRDFQSRVSHCDCSRFRPRHREERHVPLSLFSISANVC